MLQNQIQPSRLVRASLLGDFSTPRLCCIKTHSPASSSRKFSSTPSSRYPRDRNPNRGVSPLRRTGLPQPLSVSKEPLPKPLLDPARRSKLNVDENHGLWGFFNAQKEALSTPEQDDAHGKKNVPCE